MPHAALGRRKQELGQSPPAALTRTRRRLRLTAQTIGSDRHIARFRAACRAFARTVELLTPAERLAWTISLCEDLLRPTIVGSGEARAKSALRRAALVLLTHAKAQAAAVMSFPGLDPEFDADEFRIMRAHRQAGSEEPAVLLAQLSLCLPRDSQEEASLLRFLSKRSCSEKCDI